MLVRELIKTSFKGLGEVENNAGPASVLPGLPRVGEVLALINQTLDEALAEQEGDFDADSRWAITWFEECGFVDGPMAKPSSSPKARTPAWQAWWRPAFSLERRQGAAAQAQ